MGNTFFMMPYFQAYVLYSYYLGSLLSDNQCVNNSRENRSKGNKTFEMGSIEPEKRFNFEFEKEECLVWKFL